jgi:hypothetical protein
LRTLRDEDSLATAGGFVARMLMVTPSVSEVDATVADESAAMVDTVAVGELPAIDTTGSCSDAALDSTMVGEPTVIVLVGPACG